MVKTKKIDASAFAKLLKETTVLAELIRSRQDEKQSIIDQFDSESKRFYFGKISEKAIASSVRKTNSELDRLDSEIKAYIRKSEDFIAKSKRMIADQAPIDCKATFTGVKNDRAAPKKKKSSKKKPAKKAAKKVKASKPKAASKKKKPAKKKPAKKAAKKSKPAKKRSSKKKKK